MCATSVKDVRKKTGSGLTSLCVFEISYTDFGPGLVSRFTGKLVTDMTTGQEKDALLQCLQRNISSKPQDAAGEGLLLVLSMLSKIGGLIRIRSRRLKNADHGCQCPCMRGLSRPLHLIPQSSLRGRQYHPIPGKVALLPSCPRPRRLGYNARG